MMWPDFERNKQTGEKCVPETKKSIGHAVLN